MTNTISNQRSSSPSLANTILKGTGVLWFLTAVIGQWIFVYYIAGYFGPLLLQGGLEGLKETHLPHGYAAGDFIGNLAVAAHLVLAVIIVGGGPLQLMPFIRNRFPTFHHWNGRVYLLAVVATSIAGLFIVWTRGTVGGLPGLYGISLDAVLIIVFAAITVRYAIAREIDTHRRWAMRLFMVVSAVWFFRIGLMGWVLLTGGAGVDFETFTGPYLTFLFFGQYFVPLIFLELYQRAQDQTGASGKIIMAVVVVGLTGLTAVGIFGATMGMWLPRL